MKVKVSVEEVQAFADTWPCSGLQDAGPITFTFDGDDLVDIEGEPDGADDGAMVALSHDAQAGKIGTPINA